ncbi:bacteriocin resistance YdeI/OmpD-like protein [Labedella gwakjiensis]|uniref:Bacteriocin resistance YdeI/OmpD-like protein n=1 Tax=Labedella gwakjiensis TaxID=390269 RepID=A0A2P8GR73_9MICO|nr:YdeI/OmpD-associated family protein [Labedella gwakjiensis]PSL36457.1 bacteriocin resistance YdeI/OmpD-like protein [Labedella gwakjiensis]RUQ85619.1 DUF1905 domain-containing protein [Labedella gwakjiensis]
MAETFTTTLEQARKTATGIEVPPEVVDALGGGKRAAVTVTLGEYSYRSTVASMGGRFLIPVAAEHREAAGLTAGDSIAVTLELDTAPRTVEVPEDLAEALATAGVRDAFDALSPSAKKAHVTSVTGTTVAETRARRVAKVVSSLGGM